MFAPANFSGAYLPFSIESPVAEADSANIAASPNHDAEGAGPLKGRSTDRPQVVPTLIPSMCLYPVDKMLVAALQREGRGEFADGRPGLFAYNEAPTIAVAIDCWFRARRHSTRPFFLCAGV